MTKSSKEFEAFVRGFHECLQTMGNGQVSLDTMRLRRLVHANREAAYQFVEANCRMAKSQPSYLRPAYMVALAYQAEFGDGSLAGAVTLFADDLDAWEQLRGIAIPKSGDDGPAEAPER